jgi:hypothetical protein
LDTPETGRAAFSADGHLRDGRVRGIRQGSEDDNANRVSLAWTCCDSSRGTQVNELAPIGLIVTTAALEKAIALLAIHFPEKFHLEAWHALTVERNQRQAGHPARPIVLVRQRFDDLPSDVKAAMRDG